MKTFSGEDGREWVATAREEDTPRHHGRWYMVLHPSDDAGAELMIPEIRWKNRLTAERTLRTMSDFELRRRLRIGRRRHDTPGAERDPFGDWKAGGPGAKGGTRAG
jgi:hypothetical protein